LIFCCDDIVRRAGIRQRAARIGGPLSVSYNILYNMDEKMLDLSLVCPVHHRRDGNNRPRPKNNDGALWIMTQAVSLLH
jgi:hypothetical protein